MTGALSALAALLAASPAATSVPVRTVTLTPVEYANAFSTACGSPQPPAAHPANTVFVGGIIKNGNVCSLYQGLIRFDLDGLDAASIVSARLFYQAKQDYFADGAPDRNRALCIGSIGTLKQSWSSEEKSITPILSQDESLHAPRTNLKGPPIDVTPLLKTRLDEIKTNGLAFDGTVENIATKHCLAAIGQIELRLSIVAAPSM
ncbi:MAG: hypothetical protein JO219_02935 [Candidatus Eremiobacteraeota bacterium]|nr:hypothetical protein [Candidatus Eremiobacteraeota bacterium]MBV8364864.1 hypothetical protein [Candidatus Eremiobacteraeota bacterium]